MIVPCVAGDTSFHRVLDFSRERSYQKIDNEIMGRINAKKITMGRCPKVSLVPEIVPFKE